MCPNFFATAIFGILLIFIVNAVVNVWQESNAEKALEALKEIQSEHSTIKRDGRWSHGHPACDLVPGDIIELLYNCDLR
jgi:magnesium-transporting ATPase (P-type)